MSTPKKTRRAWEKEPEQAQGIIYLPCQCCGSMDYDECDGDVGDDNTYEPRTCDMCNFGEPSGSPYITLH